MMDNSNKKIARNSICPCGSGIKYKYCHSGKDLPLQNLPNNNIYGLSKDGLNFMNTIFHSMAQSNIPLFEFISDKYSIFDKTGSILEDYFLKTAMEKVEMHIGKLSATDLEFQSNMIEASLLCRYPNESNKNKAAEFSDHKPLQW